jgi:hypothetical protein
MTKFTQEEAIDSIFLKKDLSAAERTNKSRYIKGKLSQKAIEKILTDNGYNCIQEKLYVKI